MNTLLTKNSKGDRLFDVFIHVFLVLIMIVVLWPLVYVVSASFSSPHMVTSGQVWLLPKEFTLIGYETVFKSDNILRGYANSTIITVFGTIINLVATIMAAYPLSVRDFAGRNIFMGIFTFTMLFSGGIVPSFMWINNLGLYDTYWALILPGAVGVYYTIIAKTYFQSSIPYELHESAQLDGCNDIKYLTNIVLPLSAPILAVLTLYYAVGHWNAFFTAVIYLSDADKYPLQVILREIIIQNIIDPSQMVDVDELMRKQGLSELLKYSLIVVSSIPMLVLYPFIQKYFVKGVMIGALKG